MDKAATSPPQRRLRRHVTVATLALVLTAVAFSLALILPSRAQAGDTHPGGNVQDPVVLNVDIARPAVVRIFFGYANPSVTVHACAAENTTFKLPAGESFGGLGSGAFISSQGDVLTAAHVVRDEGGEVEVGLIGYFADQIAADLQKKCNLNVSDVVGYFVQNQNQITVNLGDQVERLWLDTSYHGAYSESTLSGVQSYSFQVLGVKDTYTKNGLGDDVAVIHVSGLTDTPSIALGDSSAVSPTDHLTEIGYPGNADENHIDPTSGNYKTVPTDFLTESLNDLYVSAIKTNDEGDELIQIGGNEEHGDSGGPTLNAQGKIVGVVSFGPDVSQPDALPSATGFLQASNSASSLISAAGISTNPGTFETRWRQALTDFAATSQGHWHHAVTDLTALQNDYPDFKGGADYLTYAQNQAANESASPLNLSGSTTTYIGFGLGGVAVLALIILLIVASARRSSRRKQAVREAVAVVGGGTANAASTPFTPPTNYPPQGGTYPPYPPQGGGYGPQGGTPQPPAYNPGNYPPGGNQPPSYGQGGAPPPPYNPGGNPPPPPAQLSDYRYAGPGYPSPTAPRATCANGHPMGANETYCRVCGSARL